MGVGDPMNRFKTEEWGRGEKERMAENEPGSGLEVLDPCFCLFFVFLSFLFFMVALRESGASESQRRLGRSGEKAATNASAT